MWKQRKLAFIHSTILPRFDLRTFVVLNVETACKKFNLKSLPLFENIFICRQTDSTVIFMGLGNPHGEQTMSHAHVPILSKS